MRAAARAGGSCLAVLVVAAGVARSEPALSSRQTTRPIAISGTELSLRLRDSELVVTRGAVRALLPVELAHPDLLLDLAVRTDGPLVTAVVDTNCQGSRKVSFTREALSARVENVVAARLLRRRQWSTAAEGFARAMTLDPSLGEAATNLAVAELRGGRRAEAVAALVAGAARDPLWVTWRLAADPDLAAVARAPGLAAFAPRKPVPAVRGGLEKTFVAYSPARHLVAWKHDGGSSMGEQTFSELWIADATTGAVRARLAHGDGRRDLAAIDGTLGALGFTTKDVVSCSLAEPDQEDDRPGEQNGKRDGKPATLQCRPPRTGLTVVLSKGTVRVLRGRAVVGRGRFPPEPNDMGGRASTSWAAAIPGAVLVGTAVNIGDGCGAWNYDEVLWVGLDGS